MVLRLFVLLLLRLLLLLLPPPPLCFVIFLAPCSFRNLRSSCLCNCDNDSYIGEILLDEFLRFSIIPEILIEVLSVAHTAEALPAKEKEVCCLLAGASVRSSSLCVFVLWSLFCFCLLSMCACVLWLICVCILVRRKSKSSYKG
jgi:hypothetical protein